MTAAPGRSRCRSRRAVRRPRVKSDPATSSTTQNAICPATRTSRTEIRRLTPEPSTADDALSAETRSIFDADSAGATPKSTAVSSDTGIANARTVPSTETSKSTGTGNTFVPKAETARLAQYAISVPITPPAAARTMPSPSSCPMMRPRPAPSAARMPSSRLLRGAPREQHVGDVGARNQQHETDRGQQDDAARANVAINRGVKTDRRRGDDARLYVLVSDRKLRAEAGEDRLDLASRLLHGPALGQPPLHEQPSRAALFEPVGPGSLSDVQLTPENSNRVDHRHRDPEVRRNARYRAVHASAAQRRRRNRSAR